MSNYRQIFHKPRHFANWYNNLSHAGRHSFIMSTLVVGILIVGVVSINFSDTAYAYTTLYRPNSNANATLLACRSFDSNGAPILHLRYKGNDSPFILLRTTFNPNGITTYNQKLAKYRPNWTWEGSYPIPAGASSVHTALTYDDQSKDASSISLSRVVSCGVAASQTPTPTAPSITITAPANNDKISGIVNVLISATDNQGIRSVQLKLDGTNIGNPLSSSPFTYSFNSALQSNGTHSLSAEATNTSGLTKTSQAITFLIQNVTAAPVSVIKPTSTPPLASPTQSPPSAVVPSLPVLATSVSTIRPVVPNTSWDWQIGVSGAISTANLDKSSNSHKLIDIDVEARSATEVDALKAKGYIVICYMSAGTYENWRTDAGSFPSAVLGSNVSGWAGERWLDIRSSSVLTIMESRMNNMVSKHCSGVEADNVDGYTNSPGFPLTPSDQLTYNTSLANQAHARGLSIALKNDIDQVAQLQPKFDFAINEQCVAYNECDAYAPFTSNGKAVLNAEYSATKCSLTNSYNIDSVLFALNLDNSKYKSCR
jgi:hypothetical protein